MAEMSDSVDPPLLTDNVMVIMPSGSPPPEEEEIKSETQSVSSKITSDNNLTNPVSKQLEELLSTLLITTDNPSDAKDLIQQYRPPSNLEKLVVPELGLLVPGSENVNDITRERDAELRDSQKLVTSCIIALLPLCELMLKRSENDSDLSEVSMSVIQSLKLALYAITSLVAIRKQAVRSSTHNSLCLGGTNSDDDNDTIPFLDTNIDNTKDAETLSDIACNAADGDVAELDNTEPFLDNSLTDMKTEELTEDDTKRPRRRRKAVQYAKKSMETSRRRTTLNKSPIKNKENNATVVKDSLQSDVKPEVKKLPSVKPGRRKRGRPRKQQPSSDAYTDGDEDYSPLEKTSPHKQKQSHKCPICGQVFSYRKRLTNHLEEMHTTSDETGESKCSHCNKVFSTKAKLLKHMAYHSKTVSGSTVKVSCTICNKTFRWNWLLKVHMKSHSGDKPFKCKECGKCFSMRGNLNAHMTIHSGERPFKCKECDKSFRQLGTLQYHMTTHSGSKPFQCKQCGRQFTRATSLRNHMATHTGEHPHECPHCKKRFTSLAAAKKHIRAIHWEKTGEPPKRCIRCDICDKVVLNLKRHMACHSTEKPFMCASCGKSFKTNSCLITHQKIHTGEKSHRCEVCGKCFLMAGGLKVHMLTHTGEKPHQCSICGRTFTQKSILEYHISAHKGERRHECKVCGKKYSRSHGLKIHMRTHTGERPHQCSDCGKRFSSYVCLKRHTMTHTGERPHPCPECDKRFQTSGHMKRHQATHIKDVLGLMAPLEGMKTEGLHIGLMAAPGPMDNKTIIMEPQVPVNMLLNTTTTPQQHIIAQPNNGDPNQVNLTVEIVPHPSDQPQTITYMW